KPGAVTKDKGRFVYVVHEIDDPRICKIGIASDPVRRLRAHQVSTWRRLKLAAAFTAANADEALVIEAAVHHALSGLHVSGEWFRADPERSAKEILAAAECNGLTIEPFSVSHLKSIKTNQDG